MSRAVVHITGLPLVVQGHLARQRCAWCGAVLVDEDLSCVAVADGTKYNPFWEMDRALEIEASDDGSVVRSSIIETLDGLLPDNACTPARPRRLTLVAELPPRSR